MIHKDIIVRAAKILLPVRLKRKDFFLGFHVQYSYVECKFIRKTSNVVLQCNWCKTILLNPSRILKMDKWEKKYPTTQNLYRVKGSAGSSLKLSVVSLLHTTNFSIIHRCVSYLKSCSDVNTLLKFLFCLLLKSSLELYFSFLWRVGGCFSSLSN